MNPQTYCNPDLLEAIKSSTANKSHSNDGMMTAIQSTTTENETSQVNKIMINFFILSLYKKDTTPPQIVSTETSNTTNESSTTTGASVVNNQTSSSVKNHISVDSSMTVNTSHSTANFEGQLELTDAARQGDVIPATSTNDSVMNTVDVAGNVDSGEIKTESVKFVENDVTSSLHKVCE